MPKLADNLAEGVVVRTAEELLLDTPGGPRRAMFKRKARRFTEDPRYHQAEAPAKAQSVAYGLDLLLWRADELLNANRLAAAVSKAGRPEGPAARAEVAGLLAEDVLEALGEAHPAELAALEASAQSTLRARVAEDARVLVDAAFGG